MGCGGKEGGRRVFFVKRGQINICICLRVGGLFPKTLLQLGNSLLGWDI